MTRAYRRRLPHRDVPGQPQFITWRLHDSLPEGREFQREHLSSGAAFVALDRILDRARTGPLFLRQPEIAILMREQLWIVQGQGLCTLHAWVVMPNHVHVLVTPRIPLPKLMQKIKGPTAIAANRILKRAGQPFWQPEYFDRENRDLGEFSQSKKYIEQNPVTAGFVANAEDFEWSSAWRESRKGPMQSGGSVTEVA